MEEGEEKAVVNNGHNHVDEAVVKIGQESKAPVGKGNIPQPRDVDWQVWGRGYFGVTGSALPRANLS